MFVLDFRPWFTWEVATGVATKGHAFAPSASCIRFDLLGATYKAQSLRFVQDQG